MSKESLLEELRRLALPAARLQGLEIWGLEMIDGPRPVLRLYLEAPARRAPEAPEAREAPGAPGDADLLREDGLSGEEGAPLAASATIGQCEAVSRQLSLALDAEELLDAPYTLEVSSPGFNRIFFSPEQMLPYLGDMVEARLPSPWSPGEGLPARRTWKGLLLSVEGERFTLDPARVDEEGDIVTEGLPPAALDFSQTRRVARLHVFRRPAKPGKGRGPSRRAARKSS